jgi:hypothetical protein
MFRRNLLLPSSGIKYAKQTIGEKQTAMKHHVIKAYGQACFMLVSCFTYSSTLQKEVICSSEISIDSHSTAYSATSQKTELLTTNSL